MYYICINVFSDPTYFFFIYLSLSVCSSFSICNLIPLGYIWRGCIVARPRIVSAGCLGNSHVFSCSSAVLRVCVASLRHHGNGEEVGGQRKVKDQGQGRGVRGFDRFVGWFPLVASHIVFCGLIQCVFRQFA